MSLSFLHGGIALLGIAAAVAPILIHLLLKQKPKPVVFPALQLIRKRHASTVRRMKLRHLLLLAARVALIALLGLALARPAVRSAMFAIDQEAPVAATFLFDTSLSMEYKHHGKTRLEHASELAENVIEKLPDRSEITVIDAATPYIHVPLSIGDALARVNLVTSSATTQPLNDALAEAYKGLAKAQQDRREIYIFTDLTPNGWRWSDSDRLQQLASDVEAGVRVYVINVGVEEPTNVSLGRLKLSRQVISVDNELSLTVPMHNRGPTEDHRVELFVDGQPRDVKPVRLPANESQDVEFRLPPLPEGLHQGRALVDGADGMAFDDVRYFTVVSRPPIRQLVVTDRPDNALYWTLALTVADDTDRRRGEFDLQTITSSEFVATDLQTYAVVSLLNVGSLPLEGWIKLSNFVQGGGGLFVALGERIAAGSYNSDAAQGTLPASLEQEVAPTDELFLAPQRFVHPILARFRDWQDNDMTIHPVLRYWKTKPGSRGVITIIPFSNGDPALLERSFGEGKRGRCVLLTTAAHYSPDADPWSELPLGWSYMILAEQITRYLAGLAATKLNHLAGDNVVIDFDPAERFSLFSVTDPQDHIERLAVDARDNVLTIPSVKLLGHYRVDAAEGARRFESGFSVNEPENESDLTPIEPDQLAELIGESRLSIARDPADLDRVIDEARVGRELFSWLMLVVLVMVCAEGYLANRFYKR